MKPLLFPLLTLMLGSSIALAQPLFDIRFDGDTPEQTPEVSSKPDLDGVMTRPTFIHSQDGFGTVVRKHHEALPESALLLSGKTQVDFVAPPGSFQEERDFVLSFDLVYSPGETDRSRYGLKVNLYNTNVSHNGYQASVIFVPSGIRVISGSTDQTLECDWSMGDLLKIQIRLLYSKGEMEISVNDQWQRTLPLDPAKPAGVRAVQFTGGAANSSFVAGVASIKGELQ